MTTKINKDHVRIAILFILMHNCFDIFGITQKIFGLINYYDLVFIYSLYLFLLYWMKCGKNYFSGIFTKVVLFVPILILLSSMMACLFYNQSIISGILTQRAWFISSLVYFPIRYLIKNKKLDLESFFNILYFIVFIEVSIYLIQYLLGADHYFLKVRYTYRYNSIRIVANTAYMELVLIYAMNKILIKEKVIKNIFFVVIILSYIFIVNKGRGQCFVILAIIALTILFSKIRIISKIIIISIFIIIANISFLETNVITEFSSIIFEGQKDATYNVRQESKEFYFDTMNEEPLSWILGYGMQNTTNENSNKATGVSQGYLITDNGIYGFIFSYGILGLIWYIYSLIIQIKYGGKFLIRNGDCIIIIRIIANILSITTNSNFFYTYQSFSSILIFCLIDILNINYSNKGRINK
ncbi:hypothetical protein SNJ89_02825 [Clostridium perfringens]|uniref:hypothetical protein n=1 Tax=Clostridium perfringens TaxID=1502 RepID=UPI003AF87523